MCYTIVLSRRLVFFTDPTFVNLKNSVVINYFRFTVLSVPPHEPRVLKWGLLSPIPRKIVLFLLPLQRTSPLKTASAVCAVWSKYYVFLRYNMAFSLYFRSRNVSLRLLNWSWTSLPITVTCQQPPFIFDNKRHKQVNLANFYYTKF